ncbi:MAG TPA: hypothetical protein VMK66_02490 [Myxococcales bacterium]|nr:hypothetical protein [Myxococcales bacterium]
MPVTRERVDPQRDHSALETVHRRWILPDDVRRGVPLAQLSRLWRGLIELGVLDPDSEVTLTRAGGEGVDMPAAASPGALLAGAGASSLLTQVVWTDEEGRRDPYALDGDPDPPGYRDYTLYAIDVPGRVLLPIAPVARLCAGCGKRVELQLPRFGEGVLLDLDQVVCSCGAKPDLARDKAELPNGAVFLLEELSCRAALSIELLRAPESEELPDAQVAQLIREAFGATDELADDGVPPAE